MEMDRRIEVLNTTTASDDIFFILQKVCRYAFMCISMKCCFITCSRTLSSGNADCVSAILNIIKCVAIHRLVLSLGVCICGGSSATHDLLGPHAHSSLLMDDIKGFFATYLQAGFGSNTSVMPFSEVTMLMHR